MYHNSILPTGLPPKISALNKTRTTTGSNKTVEIPSICPTKEESILKTRERHSCTPEKNAGNSILPLALMLMLFKDDSSF